MKRKIILSLILVLIILVISILIYPQKDNEILDSDEKGKNNMLSIMIEKDAGTGNYIDTSSFPSSGYYLNKNLSKCVNGSKINFSDGNLYVKGNKSDRCYAYFDKDELGSICRNQNLSECFIKNYKKDSSIIYHDEKCDYEDEENCEQEAGDLSYRYAGGNDIVHNYVCLGSECSNKSEDSSYKNLYRIIGLFQNEEEKYEIKLIKADAATKEDLGDKIALDGSAYYSDVTPYEQYYKGKLSKYANFFWNNTLGTGSSSNNTNMWSASNLNTKNLNGKYYNALEETYKKMIIKHAWQVGGFSSVNNNAKTIYELELGKNKLTEESENCYTQGDTSTVRLCNKDNDLLYKGYVGLIYVSDYMYGILPKYWNLIASNYEQEELKNNNWLYLGITEWTISRYASFGDYARVIDYRGDPHYGGDVYGFLGVRPVVYLNSSIKLVSGNGTEEKPYRISF